MPNPSADWAVVILRRECIDGINTLALDASVVQMNRQQACFLAWVFLKTFTQRLQPLFLLQVLVVLLHVLF